MGISLLKGRDFDDRDRIGTPHVAILNRTAARTFFGDRTVFASVTFLLTLVAAAGCAVPAARATRVDPAIVLRDE
jgi:ABC-type antimicrobial peptide transport system permease subunit